VRSPARPSRDEVRCGHGASLRKENSWSRESGLLESGDALLQEGALASVARERGRVLKLRPCLVHAAELDEKVAPHTRQEVVALERRLRGQRIDDLEARCRPK